MRLKRDKRDDIFSRLIRAKDKWKCQRCKKQYNGPSPSLHCSHFWSRRHRATRWDEDNCTTLCYGCHSFLGGNPELHRQWYLEKIGQQKYDFLEKKARSIVKYTKTDLELIYEDLKKRYHEIVNKSGNFYHSMNGPKVK